MVSLFFWSRALASYCPDLNKRGCVSSWTCSMAEAVPPSCASFHWILNLWYDSREIGGKPWSFKVSRLIFYYFVISSVFTVPSIVLVINSMASFNSSNVLWLYIRFPVSLDLWPIIKSIHFRLALALSNKDSKVWRHSWGLFSIPKESMMFFQNFRYFVSEHFFPL